MSFLSHSRQASADMKQVQEIPPQELLELPTHIPRPSSVSLKSHLRRISGMISPASPAINSVDSPSPPKGDEYPSKDDKSVSITIEKENLNPTLYDTLCVNQVAIFLGILILFCIYDSLFPSSLTIKALMMDPFSKLLRYLAHPAVDFLLPYTWITPDDITWIHLTCGIIGSFFIASNNPNMRRFGVMLHFLRHLLDHIDGPLSRARKEIAATTTESPSSGSAELASIFDFDMIADTIGSISFGIAVFVYSIRNGLRPEKGYVFVAVFVAIQITLKGLVLDYLMEIYKLNHIRPAIISCFFWKISSYDCWENLKLFALLFGNELEFYSFSASFGLLWVGLPTMISVLDLFFFLG